MKPLTRQEIKRAADEAGFCWPSMAWGKIESDESGNLTGMACMAATIAMGRGVEFEVGAGGYLYPRAEDIAMAHAILEELIRYCQAMGLLDPRPETWADTVRLFIQRQTEIMDALQRRLA
jgi:hypothetical protein